MKYVIAIFFLIASLLVTGQSVVLKGDLDKKGKKLYQEALDASRNRNYSESIKQLDKLLAREPNFLDGILMKSGMLYNQGKLEQSIAVLGKGIALDPDYDPLMYYSLATMYNELDVYDKAVLNYQLYLDRSPQGDKAKRAIKLMEQAKFADEQINNPVPFKPESLGPLVNTEHSEYIPQLSIDGSHIIFTRRIDGQEDFYRAAIEGDSIFSVEPIEELNTPYNEGVHTMSADGKMLIYTACDRRLGEGSCDLFYAFRKGDTWQPGAGFASSVNSPAWDAQPSLSADGKMLFFSSNRPDGYGGRDIWVTIKNDTAGWLKPQPLSDKINTPYDEESPFIHPDGRTLYFRSNGHLGMGSYDIFYSTFDVEHGGWSEPKNIGYPINTKGNEGALSVSLDGKTAYFASDMAHLDAEKKHLDIYRFELYPEARPLPTTFVKATITDSETGTRLAAQYRIKDVQHNIILTQGQAEAGTLIYALPTRRHYALTVDMPGYVFHSENFNLSAINSSIDPYLLEIELQKIPAVKDAGGEPAVTRPVILNNVFFVSGSAGLRPESHDELEKLVSLLRDYKDSQIVITGHTDNVGQPEDNLKLSQDRASSVKEYLVKSGISETRITTQGKGELEPIAANDTPAGRQKNRRVEFVIK